MKAAIRLIFQVFHTGESTSKHDQPLQPTKNSLDLHLSREKHLAKVPRLQFCLSFQKPLYKVARLAAGRETDFSVVLWPRHSISSVIFWGPPSRLFGSQKIPCHFYLSSALIRNLWEPGESNYSQSVRTVAGFHQFQWRPCAADSVCDSASWSLQKTRVRTLAACRLAPKTTQHGCHVQWEQPELYNIHDTKKSTLLVCQNPKD